MSISKQRYQTKNQRLSTYDFFTLQIVVVTLPMESHADAKANVAQQPTSPSQELSFGFDLDVLQVDESKNAQNYIPPAENELKSNENSQENIHFVDARFYDEKPFDSVDIDLPNIYYISNQIRLITDDTISVESESESQATSKETQSSVLSTTSSTKCQDKISYIRPTIRFQHEIEAKISYRQKRIIFGFIHEFEKQYENKIIPTSIIYLFAAYFCEFQDEWNKKYCGSNIMFIGHKIIKKLLANKVWTVCAFGYQINNKICDKLNIQFTWKSITGLTDDINIGYIKINKINSVKFDGCELGENENINNSVCIEIDDYRSGITDYDSEDGLSASSDTFIVISYMVTFDFIQERILLKRDNQVLGSMKFKCKSILPAIAICNKGEMIEVSKYELCHNDKDY